MSLTAFTLLPFALISAVSGAQSTVQFNLRVTVPVSCAIASVELDAADSSAIEVATNCNAEFFDLAIGGALADNSIANVQIDRSASASFGANQASFRQQRPGRSNIRITFEDELDDAGAVQLQLFAK